MKKFLMLLLCCMAFLISSTAYSLTIDIYDNVDNLIILEDFENSSAGWHGSLDTNVGTFTAAGAIGSGATSYNHANDPDSTDPYFSIQDRTNSWYGRYNTTTTPGASQWLDSGDITELILDVDIDSSYNSLYFYMMDPSDCGATTTVNGESNYVSFDFNFGEDGREPNGAAFLVGITWEDDEILESITFSTNNHQSDGYGLDDFATVAAPVPEPATMLLLGTGLFGLAAFRRKKK